MELATKGSNEFSGDQNILGNVGIGTTTLSGKTQYLWSDMKTQLCYCILLEMVPMHQPILNLWHLEPAASYTGVGIGNNIKHWNSVTLFPDLIMREELLYMRDYFENQIVFTTVDVTGNLYQALKYFSDPTAMLACYQQTRSQRN